MALLTPQTMINPFTASLLFALALLQAACSPSGNVSGPTVVYAPPSEPATAHGYAQQSPTTRSIATLPDRGDFVRYRNVAPRREGPSTWHQAEVSEEHALRAAVSGSLRMTAPDGGILNYRFRRHIEYPDGNWSWIGQAPGVGGQAIITFGERAVFGLFPRPGRQPLQLTVRDGVAWFVEADPTALRGVDSDEGLDYVVASAAVKDAVGAQATMASQAATATGGPVVDLVLGYTAGFAAGLGGESQAVTRLTHLVTVTNQAYANSQLDAQVRLVRTVQVNYPDATSNETALEELTGSDGSSSIPVPASLAVLRQARDQYGADLVSLVRKFNEPENEGCGIAWLIGGGGSSFTASKAPWGYSIVSDGSDSGYFCRVETLAHELGHNMGQNHNAEDAGGDSGVHAYSYGYREASATGFFTIMAYRLSGDQYPVPYFANPNVTADGRPTGVANASDNVRSMQQVLPVVASFRATVVAQGRPDADFNGDGYSDILWRHSGSGANTIWRSANSAARQGMLTISSQAWKIAGTGDFDGDGVSDVLWRNSSTGAGTIWRSANAQTPMGIASVSDLEWAIVGTGDFNGDGVDDILWRHSLTGSNAIWLSASHLTPQGTARVSDLRWKVAGVGDFNGDGKDDILWRHASTGANTIWLSGSNATVQSVARINELSWAIVGVGDFNADGKDDILWRNMSSGANTIWRSGNASETQGMLKVSSQAWAVVAVADYNGDGTSDILWRNSSTGANTIWRSGRHLDQQSLPTISDMGWQVIGK